MHIDPDHPGTARDFAREFGRQQLPPPANRAAVDWQLTDSTLRLLGHAETAAPHRATGSALEVGSALGSSFDSGDVGSDSSSEIASSPVDSAGDELDSLAIPPPWSDAPAEGLGSALSYFQSTDDPFAFSPSDSIAPLTLLPTALDSSPDALTPAVPAVDSDWSEPPALPPGDAPAFEVADGSSLAGPLDNSQSDIGRAPTLTVRDPRSAGRAETRSATATSGETQSAQPVSIAVTLTDREQLIAAATAKVAALAKAAAESTAGCVVDQRLSNLRTQDDASKGARAAVFGS
jgi:hypothetical protein